MTEIPMDLDKAAAKINYVLGLMGHKAVKPDTLRMVLTMALTMKGMCKPDGTHMTPKERVYYYLHYYLKLEDKALKNLSSIDFEPMVTDNA